MSDAPEYKLSLIIPAYNEEKRLKNMLGNVLEVLKSKISSERKYNCEVILVDDGSMDKTVEVYKKVVSAFGSSKRIDFKLLKLAKNSGKGFAVSEVYTYQIACSNTLIFFCYGILSSLGETILFADADGSTDFEALNKFEKSIHGKVTEDVLICGSRCHLQSDAKAVVKVKIIKL